MPRTLDEWRLTDLRIDATTLTLLLRAAGVIPVDGYVTGGYWHCFPREALCARVRSATYGKVPAGDEPPVVSFTLPPEVAPP